MRILSVSSSNGVYRGQPLKQPHSTEPSFESRFVNGMKKPRHIKPFLAMRDWVMYSPKQKDFGGYKIPVHNEEIFKRLKPSYTSKEFEDMFEFVNKKGTFDYVMDEKTGFIKTSFINRKENPLMSDLIWITDTCNNLELVKYKNPEDCTKILNKLTDFYVAEQGAFDEMISNPEPYKSNPFWPNGQVGVGHCFVPNTHKPHHWFAKTRLESVGNYLQAACDLVESGFAGKDYGYKNVSEVPDKVVDAVANCTEYLAAIHYPTARSCGAWEEQTFVNSLTSDTAIVNQGIRDVMKLMYSNTDDRNLLLLRERILNSKHGDVFNDEQGLRKLLRAGEKRVEDIPFVETFKGDYDKPVEVWVEKCLARDYDAAMSFMVQTERLNKNIVADTAQKLALLKRITKALVRPNGALRYQGDEYLNLDYHRLENTWTKNKKSNEAEWFLVSEISSAYGVVAKNLLDYMDLNGSNPKLDKLLKFALDGQTEFINRSYARITPRNMTKSNGYSCPEYKVPEAYEAITTPKGIRYVPGAHPLTWAEASLMKASRLFAENLKRVDL